MGQPQPVRQDDKSKARNKIPPAIWKNRHLYHADFINEIFTKD